MEGLGPFPLVDPERPGGPSSTGESRPPSSESHSSPLRVNLWVLTSLPLDVPGPFPRHPLSGECPSDVFGVPET